jgi:NDP-sugar pyrophosphorylase family protein
VILCGGLGTRLRPAVADRPKVLAPVNGTPFLDLLLRALRRRQARDVVLSVGHRAGQVRDFAGDGTRWDLRVRYAEEPEPLGTGGALRFTADALGLDEPFLAMNGDTFFSGALAALVRFHRARAGEGVVASLALVPRPEGDRYGAVETGADDAVRAFREKEEAGDADGKTPPRWINAGVYLLEPALVEAIPTGRKVSLEREVFPQWVGRGLYARPFPEAAFLDIGTPEDYARAAAMLGAPGGGS